MKVKINLDDVYMSDMELLEMLELSLNLDYDRSYVQNGVVYRRISNNSDDGTGIKTVLPGTSLQCLRDYSKLSIK